MTWGCDVNTLSLIGIGILIGSILTLLVTSSSMRFWMQCVRELLEELRIERMKP
jgi:uncharacterized membrane protein YczE